MSISEQLFHPYLPSRPRGWTVAVRTLQLAKWMMLSRWTRQGAVQTSAVALSLEARGTPDSHVRTSEPIIGKGMRRSAFHEKWVFQCKKERQSSELGVW